MNRWILVVIVTGHSLCLVVAVMDEISNRLYIVWGCQQWIQAFQIRFSENDNNAD